MLKDASNKKTPKELVVFLTVTERRCCVQDSF